jgi:hypothetical protein
LQWTEDDVYPFAPHCWPETVPELKFGVRVSDQSLQKQYTFPSLPADEVLGHSNPYIDFPWFLHCCRQVTIPDCVAGTYHIASGEKPEVQPLNAGFQSCAQSLVHWFIVVQTEFDGDSRE